MKTQALASLVLASTLLTGTIAATAATEPPGPDRPNQNSSPAATQPTTRPGAVDPSTVVFLGDSQLAGPGPDSWAEQAAQQAGLSTQTEHAYGGLGYVSTNLYAGGSAEQAISDNVLPPQQNPGTIILTLGGNDATTGASDTAILKAATATWDGLARKYPNAKIIINGVMSRTDEAHTRRREVDTLITSAAKNKGLRTIPLAGLATTAGADGLYQDNVHLTQAGHNRLSDAYQSLLEKELKR